MAQVCCRAVSDISGSTVLSRDTAAPVAAEMNRPTEESGAPGSLNQMSHRWHTSTGFAMGGPAVRGADVNTNPGGGRAIPTPGGLAASAVFKVTIVIFRQHSLTSECADYGYL